MNTTKRMAFMVVTIASLIIYPFFDVATSMPAYADINIGTPTRSSLHPRPLSTIPDDPAHTFSSAGILPDGSPSKTQSPQNNATSFMVATPLSVTEPTPQLTGDYFNTYAAEYKGMNVGFNVHDFGVIDTVTVDLYQNDRKIVTNTGTQALYTAIDGGQTQIISPFYTQGAAANVNWNMGAYNWGFADQPTGAVITVAGTFGTKTITISPLCEANSVTFKSLILDTTAPSIPSGGTPNGVSVSTSNINFAWQTSSDDSGDSPTYNMQYSQDKAFADATTVTTSTPSFHVDSLADGTWYWRVNASDTAGNTSTWSETYTVAIDTKGPSISTNLSENESLGGIRTVRTTTDADSWQVDVYMASDLDHPLLSSTKTDTEIDTTKLANGKYVAIWTAHDTIGNASHLTVPFQVNNIVATPNEATITTTTDTLPTVALAPLFFTPDATNSTAMETFGRNTAVGKVNGTQSSTPSISPPQITDIGRGASSNAGLQASQSGWRLFGINWYWWLLGAGAIGIIVRQMLLKQK